MDNEIWLDEFHAIGRKVEISDSKSLYYTQKGTIILLQEVKVIRILGFPIAREAVFTVALEGGITTEFKSSALTVLGTVE